MSKIIDSKMAKNKKPQQAPKLSPENYIRQKARNLPLNECLINSNWKEIGTANIVISRNHANENFTFAVYMLDLYCFGITNTYYGFNTEEAQYEDLKEVMKEDFEVEKIPYILAHNIIFAAYADADELGFKSDKNFKNVTQYLLKDDKEDIELIDIECGRDGQPVYIVSEDDSAAKVKQVIVQLEKTVGKGNFTVIYPVDEEDAYESENEHSNLNLEALKRLFLEMSKKNMDDYTDEDRITMTDLTNKIYLEVFDKDEVENLIEKWKPELEIKIAEDDYNNEFLGISPDIIVSREDKEKLDDLLTLVSETPKKAKKPLEYLFNKLGNIPYLCYLKLLYMISENKNEYSKKVSEYHSLYPDYPLLRLRKTFLTMMISSEKNSNHIPNFKNIFINRKSITLYEMSTFQVDKLMCILKHGIMLELEAMYSQIDDVSMSNETYKYLKTILLLQRIELLQKYFK